RRTRQPSRAPDSASFFVGGRPLDYVEDLFSADSLRRSGLFDVDRTTRLFAKARAGRATGFADNQAFVGILSTLLLQRSPPGTVQGRQFDAAAGSSRSSLPLSSSVST